VTEKYLSDEDIFGPKPTPAGSNSGGGLLSDEDIFGKAEPEGRSLVQQALVVPRGVAAALPAFNEGLYGTGSAAAEYIGGGENAVSRWLDERADESAATRERWSPEEDTWFGRQVQGAAQSVGSMIPGLAATAITKNPLFLTSAFLAPGVVTETGQATREAQEEGLDAGEALGYGVRSGALEAAFGAIPASRLATDIVKGSGFGSIFMRQLATELPTEVATTVAQNLNQWLTLNPEKEFGDWIAEQPAAIRDTIVQTAMATGAVSGAASIVSNRGGKADEPDSAEAKVTVGETDPAVEAALGPDTINSAVDETLNTEGLNVEPAAIPTAPPVAPPVVQPTPEPAPAPTPEATPLPEGTLGFVDETTVSEPTEAEIRSEPPTVPEAPATLAEQLTALADGTNPRWAMFVPLGTNFDPAFFSGMKAVPTPDGMLYINTRKGRGVKAAQALYKSGQLNEMLGLGPYNKEDVAESAAAGNPEIAVTERTPEGVEVKAAAGTSETVGDQLLALEETKTPGNTVQTETPEQVYAGREQGALEVTPEVTPAPIAPVTPETMTEPAPKQAEATQEITPPVEDQPAPIEALAGPIPAPEKPAVEKPTTPVEKPAEKAAPVEKPEPPKAAAVKAVAKRRAKKKVVVAPKAQKVATVKQTEEGKAEFEAAREKERAERIKREADKEGNEDKVYTRTEKRTEDREKIAEDVATGKMKKGGEEQVARIMSGSKKKSRKEVAVKVDRAVQAQSLMDEYGAKKIEEIKSKEDVNRLRERLGAIVTRANAMGVKTPKRIDKSHADSVLWLDEVRRMYERLNTKRPPSIEDIQNWAIDEGSMVSGNTDPVYARRSEQGDAAKRQSAGTAVIEQVADATAPAVDADDVTTKVSGNRRGAARVQNNAEEVTSEVRNVWEEAGHNSRAAMEADILAKYGAVVRRMDWLTLGDAADLQVAMENMSDEQVLILNEIMAAGDTYIAMPHDARMDLHKAVGVPLTDSLESMFASERLTIAEAREMFKSPDFLAEMAEDSARPEMQTAVGEAIMDVYSKLVADVPIYALPDAVFDMFGKGAGGYYNGANDTIVLPESVVSGDVGTMSHIVVHESSHAAMDAALASSDKMRAKVRTLMEITKSATEADGRTVDAQGDTYWYANEHEFMTEAMSNAKFQEDLASIVLTPAQKMSLGIVPTKHSSIRTAFDAVRNWVVDHLGLDRILRSMGVMPGDGTAFDAALDIAGVLTSRAPFARAQARADFAKLNSIRAIEKPSMRESLHRMGVTREDADAVAKRIEDMYDGKASDAQLRKIADRIRSEYKEVTSEGKKTTKEIASRYHNSQNEVRKRIDEGKSEALKQAQKEFVPEKTPGRPRLVKLLTNYQIAVVGDKYFGKENNPLRKIAEAIEARRVGKARYLKQLTPVVEDIMAAAKRHSKDTFAEFQKLAHDSTMAGIHPDRTLAENTQISKTGFTDEWNRAQHRELSRRYEALPQDLKDLYARTRDTLTETQNQMSRKLIENILTKADVAFDDAMVDRFHDGKPSDADKAAVGEELANHMANATELHKIKGPYFNLTRRGNWVVQGTYKVDPPANARQIGDNVFEFKDEKEARAWVRKQELNTKLESRYVDVNTGETTFPDGTVVSKNDLQGGLAEKRYYATVQNKHVEFVDSRREAKRVQKALREEGLTVQDVEPKRYERNAQNAEMLSDQFSAMSKTIEKRLKDKGGKFTDAQKNEMAAMMNEVSLRFLGSTRIQSSKMPRRFVQGASHDLARNTFEYTESASGYLARLDTAPALEEHAKELEARVAALSKADTGAGEGARILSNESERRMYRDLPGEDDGVFNKASQRLTGIAFVDALMSPAYSMINASQVGMFTLPMLAGDFSAIKATAAVTAAYRDLGALGTIGSGVKDTWRAVKGEAVTGDHFIGDAKRKLSSQNERDMIDHLADIGLIDADGGMEIARILDAHKNTAGAVFDRGLYHVDNVVRAMPQAIEAVNRTVTALAAYRLKFKETGDHQKSVQYAGDMVNNTQALMSNSNAAPIFSNPVARVSLQFKKFGQMTYFLMTHNIGRAINPMEKGDRVKAIKSMAYFTAATQVMAGTVGMPFEPIKLAAMIFAGLGQEDWTWEDFQEQVEEFYKQLTGSDDAARALTYGVTSSDAIFGDWATDLNSRLGLDSLILFGEPRSGSEEDWKSYMFDTLAGPIGRTGGDFLDGMSEALQGNYDELYKMIPVKLVHDAGRAWTKAAEGDMTTQDAILRTVGFTSADQAEKWRDIGRDIRGRNRSKQEYNSLIRDFIEADSTDDIIAARLAVQQYNRTNPGKRPISIRWLTKRRREERMAK
jgi:hypothetical protein